jgi:hypothetical protein
VALVTLAGAPGWLPATTVLVAAVVPLLALRAMTSGWQRLALGIPSLVALLAVVIMVADRSGPQLLPVLVVIILAVTATVSSAAHTLPQRPLTPIWGRIGDLLHIFLLVALLPLALGVLGGYAKIRELVG